MREQIIKCDGCQKVKGEANHWFGVKQYAPATGGVSFAIIPFDSIKYDNGWEHFCGEECLLRQVARNLPK